MSVDLLRILGASLGMATSPLGPPLALLMVGSSG